MSQQQIKVVKRAERSGPHDARSPPAEPSVNEEARALAATVNEWVSEFRQTRLKQHQEIKRQLGWPEVEDRYTERHVGRDPHEEEM
jgi:hypothetical protein